MSDEDLKAEDTTPDEGGDFLEMSDEDFMKMGGADQADLSFQNEESEDEESDEDAEDDGEAVAEADEEDDESEEDPAEDDEDDEGDDEDAERREDEESEEDEGESDSGDDSSSDDDEDTSSEDEEETSDAQTFFEKVTAPFNANGREMQITSAEDVVQLMQMGANYNRKMQALKPSMKALRTLEKHDLLDEEKLNHVIDLVNGDEKAIASFLKAKGIDPEEFELSQGDDYKAGNNMASDEEVALEDVVQRIQGTESYNKTLEIVGKQWDDTSRKAVSDNPTLLETINEHVSNGIYEVISEQLERQRMLGKIPPGTPDIQAYKIVGDAIQAQGGFNHLFQEEASSEDKGNETPRKEATRSKGDDSKRRNKRKAASTTRRAKKPAKTDKDFSPLAMSDEEFAKQFNPSLM